MMMMRWEMIYDVMTTMKVDERWTAEGVRERERET